MAAVGTAQITEQNIVLYPVDNRKYDSDEYHCKGANIVAKKSSDKFPVQLLFCRLRKKHEAAPDNDGINDIDHPLQSNDLQDRALLPGFVLYFVPHFLNLQRLVSSGSLTCTLALWQSLIFLVIKPINSRPWRVPSDSSGCIPDR